MLAASRAAPGSSHDVLWDLVLKGSVFSRAAMLAYLITFSFSNNFVIPSAARALATAGSRNLLFACATTAPK